VPGAWRGPGGVATELVQRESRGTPLSPGGLTQYEESALSHGTNHSKKGTPMSVKSVSALIRTAGVLSVSLLIALAFSGCQTPGESVKTEKCSTCPLCHHETRLAPIKGMTYTRVVCPDCRKVGNTGTWDELRGLHEVWVCDHCKTIVAPCAKCAAKRARP
jgi:hypothetical protein